MMWPCVVQLSTPLQVQCCSLRRAAAGKVDLELTLCSSFRHCFRHLSLSVFGGRVHGNYSFFSDAPIGLAIALLVIL